MSELVVVGYNDKWRAGEVLNELRRMQEDWVVDLEDAVAVFKREDGKLKIQQSYDLEEEGAGWGALWGSLAGALLAIPFTGGLSGAAAAAAIAAGSLSGGALGAAGGAIDAAFWKEKVGLSEDFIKEVGAMIKPGTSAIFAILRTYDPIIVVDKLSKYGGTLLKTSLNPEQDELIQSVLSHRGKA